VIAKRDVVRLRVRDAFTPEIVDEAQTKSLTAERETSVVIAESDVVRLRVRDAFTPKTVGEAQTSVVSTEGLIVRLRVRDAFAPQIVDEAQTKRRRGADEQPTTRAMCGSIQDRAGIERLNRYLSAPTPAMSCRSARA